MKTIFSPKKSRPLVYMKSAISPTIRRSFSPQTISFTISYSPVYSPIPGTPLLTKRTGLRRGRNWVESLWPAAPVPKPTPSRSRLWISDSGRSILSPFPFPTSFFSNSPIKMLLLLQIRPSFPVSPPIHLKCAGRRFLHPCSSVSIRGLIPAFQTPCRAARIRFRFRAVFSQISQ
jgi:hypothetical protein